MTTHVYFKCRSNFNLKLNICIQETYRHISEDSRREPRLE